MTLPAAQYDRGCSVLSEKIGHPVPGLKVLIRYAIMNEYPAAIQYSNGNAQLVGYFYTTWGSGHGKGGQLFFVGVDGSLPWAKKAVNSATSILIGENSLIKNKLVLVRKLRQILVQFLQPTAIHIAQLHDIQVQQSCFSSDWQGNFPN